MSHIFILHYVTFHIVILHYITLHILKLIIFALCDIAISYLKILVSYFGDLTCGCLTAGQFMYRLVSPSNLLPMKSELFLFLIAL
jgi:hypothetical protein